MITIAIPFYRGLDYLRRAIDSVLAQTVADWALIVADDGPGEGAEELVRAYQDPRITYVRNPVNLGMAGNWNRCLELARSDLVTLLHADDELLPGYVRLMSEAAGMRPESALFFCGARIIDEASRPAFSFPDFYKRFLKPARAAVYDLRGEEALAALLRGNFIMCPTVCYRRSRIGARRFRTDQKQVLDLEFTTGLLFAGETLTGLGEVAYAYRRHGENATTHQTQSLLRFEEEVAIYGDLAAEAARRGWTRAAAIGRRKRIIRLNLLYCIVTDLARLRFLAAQRKARFLAGLS